MGALGWGSKEPPFQPPPLFTTLFIDFLSVLVLGLLVFFFNLGFLRVIFILRILTKIFINGVLIVLAFLVFFFCVFFLSVKT